uniref:Uncharacterized protein n=1 Tax=Oryza brachyantha TaxID=4533 RepID=J3MB43_ORYBR
MRGTRRRALAYRSEGVHSSRTAAWSLDSRSFFRAPPPPSQPASSSSPLPADLSAVLFPLPLDTGLPGEHGATLSSSAATAPWLPSCSDAMATPEFRKRPGGGGGGGEPGRRRRRHSQAQPEAQAKIQALPLHV